ncbi:NAD(P)H-hydrate dehydratase [Sphingomonas panacisoli]|uniref:Bifunctional NAD(P)H-hydrate repair enzyme n=1 Tax=Sphingomonas panacisoli TaxID=1813879 RepID=A0A5B8LH39_9SPHN|nr:NAD(P)H-hydrate dehydratase [Sphingomonas panacisoli]QDZ07587.1 NAD(P)H-hydrate dehydratase [Sphingomonas panacisoli]
MTPIDGQPILTAAQMRAAEDRAIAAGSSVEELMERAGAGVAEAVRRLAAESPVLILCGPGNNGGDGYVAARVLRKNGVEVRVAAMGDPKTDAARKACEGLGLDVEPFGVDLIDRQKQSPVLVDAIFGTGLSREVDARVADTLGSLVACSRLPIAVDLPSGVDTDSGAALSRSLGHYRLTLALGALKPAHVLEPAAQICGAVRVLDIGLHDLLSPYRVLAKPDIGPPPADAHKYSRGLVAVIGGDMPGASALAAEAAMRAGAGYILLFNESGAGDPPHALVRQKWSPSALRTSLDGKKAAAIVVGPGLGRGKEAERKLDTAIETDMPLVIDGDALHLLDADRLKMVAGRRSATILTPHAGEFKAVFGDYSGSKIDASLRAAARSAATVVFKGPDTVIATAHGDVTVAPAGSSWLSTAGTGDVLAGAIGAMIAAGEAPDAAVWMHGEAARRLGGSFIADDLARELSAVRASL